MSPVQSALAAGSLTLLVAAGVLLQRLGDRRLPRQVALLAGAGACGTVAALLEVSSSLVVLPGRLYVAAGLVLLPLALALYPDDRPPRGLGPLALVPALATGGLALLYPTPFVSTGLAGLVSFVLVALLLWWRHEHAGEDVVRRAVLWLLLGAGVAVILGALAGFVLPERSAAVCMAVCFTFAVGCLVLGLVAPEAYDVRTACVIVAVHIVTAFLLVALFSTGLAVVDATGHARPLSDGQLGLLAAVCAVGYHPTVTLLRGVVDRLLFGDRRAPLDAASRVGQRLGDDPVLALRALRESLALPYVALVDGSGETVASTGTPITEVVGQHLSAARPELGRLDVGLRLGEVSLPRRDREVLAVVGPALAQLMHARRLSAQLHTSRAGVVAAVEEERRRLRRDLHDGLGPRLTGVAYAADAATNLVSADPDRALALLVSLRAETGDAIKEIRGLVDGLRPAALDQVGLVEALRVHARGLRASDGSPMTVDIDASDVPVVGAAIEVTAYRIVVEALTNAARHSTGRHCCVALRVQDSRLLVEVGDDGEATGPWVPGVGLTSMRERVELLAGSFEASADARGGLVRVLLPL